jgi:hypothetical protein
MALELLTACGMIRRSEKRSLIGTVALDTWTRVLNSDRRVAAEALPSSLNIPLYVLGTSRGATTGIV